MMTRARLIAAGATILGAALGLFAGWLFDSEILGAVTGAVIGLPLGQALVTKRRRWLAAIVLNILFVLSFVVGGWWGSMYALAVSALTFFISAAILRSLYGGSEFKALGHHLRLATGLARSIQIIDQGQTVVPSDAAFLMGPHLILVRPDNAVILERGPQQTRVSGPAVIGSKPFEYVKRIFDLRQKQETFAWHNVLTEDLMATTVEISVTYGINISVAGRRGQTTLTPSEIDTIQRIDSQMPDWQSEAKAAIEGSVRRAVSSWSLDDLLTHRTFNRLENHILTLANRKVSRWGITIRQVVVKNVQPEQEVTAATASLWLADAEAAVASKLERARAFAWRDALKTLADGYKDAIAMGMPDAAIHREMLRRALEQIAKDPATKLILTPELDSALGSLRRSIGLEP